MTRHCVLEVNGSICQYNIIIERRTSTIQKTLFTKAAVIYTRATEETKTFAEHDTVCAVSAKNTNIQPIFGKIAKVTPIKTPITRSSIIYRDAGPGGHADVVYRTGVKSSVKKGW